MITLESNKLVFRFPEISDEAEFSLEFQRTLRLPDDGRTYPLPAGLGNFPLSHVDDYAAKLPSRTMRRGGVAMPMWQSEAMWINFRSQSQYPFAVKIATGKINAITGRGWTETLQDDPQDYLVVTKQPWFDGYCVEKGVVRQFVAVRLGKGVTVEEQITGAAENGGLQVIAYPMKREFFESLLRRHRYDQLHEPHFNMLADKTAEMGFSAGGKMRQEILEDPYGVEAWDQSVSSRCFVSVLNAENWKELTGMDTPTKPITQNQYKSANIPWFDYYDRSAGSLGGSSILSRVKSILGGTEGSIDPPLSVNSVGPSIRPVTESRSETKDVVTTAELRRQLTRLSSVAGALKLLQTEVSTAVALIHEALNGPVNKKGPKTKLRILHNGHSIIREHAADALAEAVRRIGVEKIYPLGLKLGGLPFVGKSLPPPDRGFRKIEDWIVGTHASNADKKIVLEEIAARLSIDLKVDLVRPIE